MAGNVDIVDQESWKALADEMQSTGWVETPKNRTDIKLTKLRAQLEVINSEKGNEAGSALRNRVLTYVTAKTEGMDIYRYDSSKSSIPIWIKIGAFFKGMVGIKTVFIDTRNLQSTVNDLKTIALNRFTSQEKTSLEWLKKKVSNFIPSSGVIWKIGSVLKAGALLLAGKVVSLTQRTIQALGYDPTTKEGREQALSYMAEFDAGLEKNALLKGQISPPYFKIKKDESNKYSVEIAPKGVEKKVYELKLEGDVIEGLVGYSGCKTVDALVQALKKDGIKSYADEAWKVCEKWGKEQQKEAKKLTEGSDKRMSGNAIAHWLGKDAASKVVGFYPGGRLSGGVPVYKIGVGKDAKVYPLVIDPVSGKVKLIDGDKSYLEASSIAELNKELLVKQSTDKQRTLASAEQEIKEKKLYGEISQLSKSHTEGGLFVDNKTWKWLQPAEDTQVLYRMVDEDGVFSIETKNSKGEVKKYPIAPDGDKFKLIKADTNGAFPTGKGEFSLEGIQDALKQISDYGTDITFVGGKQVGGTVDEQHQTMAVNDLFYEFENGKEPGVGGFFKGVLRPNYFTKDSVEGSLFNKLEDGKSFAYISKHIFSGDEEPEYVLCVIKKEKDKTGPTVENYILEPVSGELPIKVRVQKITIDSQKNSYGSVGQEIFGSFSEALQKYCPNAETVEQLKSKSMPDRQVSGVSTSLPSSTGTTANSVGIKVLQKVNDTSTAQSLKKLSEPNRKEILEACEKCKIKDLQSGKSSKAFKAFSSTYAEESLDFPKAEGSMALRCVAWLRYLGNSSLNNEGTESQLIEVLKKFKPEERSLLQDLANAYSADIFSWKAGASFEPNKKRALDTLKKAMGS